MSDPYPADATPLDDELDRAYARIEQLNHKLKLIGECTYYDVLKNCGLLIQLKWHLTVILKIEIHYLNGLET